jgi:competence protein ComEC
VVEPELPITRSGAGRREWLAVVAVCLAALLVLGLGLQRTLSSESAPAEPEQAVEAPTSRRLVVTFLDVWQGDAAFIRTPGGRTMLIDGGNRGNEYSAFDGGLDVIIPFLETYGIEQLDLVVGTHPHNDHIGGLVSVLERIPVKRYMDPGMTYTSETYLRLMELVEEKGIEYSIGKRGEVVPLDPAVQLQVLGPKSIHTRTFSDVNNASLVLRLVYRRVSFLFAADIEIEAERDLIAFGAGLRSTFLKIPHHGSDTSSSELFRRRVQPAAGIISVGAHNKFGHPSVKVINAYRKAGTRIYRTDYHGNITVVTDGSAYTILTER